MDTVMNSHIADIKQYFNNRGYKLTKPRLEVLEAIAELNDRFLSCSDVHELLKEKLNSTGLSTVYRTISLLEEVELLHKVHAEDGCARYQYDKQAGSKSNLQLICTSCGSVIEDNLELIGAIKNKMLVDNNFEVKGTKIKIYGCCRNCE